MTDPIVIENGTDRIVIHHQREFSLPQWIWDGTAVRLGFSWNAIMVLTNIYRRSLGSMTAWPGYDRIAQDCDISERSVRRGLKQLQEFGVIEVEHWTEDSKTGQIRSTIYNIRGLDSLTGPHEVRTHSPIGPDSQSNRSGLTVQQLINIKRSKEKEAAERARAREEAAAAVTNDHSGEEQPTTEPVCTEESIDGTAVRDRENIADKRSDIVQELIDFGIRPDQALAIKLAHGADEPLIRAHFQSLKNEIANRKTKRKPKLDAPGAWLKRSLDGQWPLRELYRKNETRIPVYEIMQCERRPDGLFADTGETVFHSDGPHGSWFMRGGTGQWIPYTDVATIRDLTALEGLRGAKDVKYEKGARVGEAIFADGRKEIR